MMDACNQAIDVLVIDDDGDLNQLLGEYLVQDQFQYHQALSGGEGLTLAGTVHPDVVVLDLMLPDMDGYEVCHRMKTQRATCDIPVILLTCLCHTENVRQGLLCGAFTHVSKPYEPEQVIRCIRDAAAWRQRLAQHAEPRHGCLDVADLEQTCHTIQEMLVDLVLHTGIDDAALQEIYDAFMLLIAPGGSQNLRTGAATPHFDLEYAYVPDSSEHRCSVRWTLSQNVPAMLDAVLHPDAAVRATAASDRAILRADWERFLKLGGLRVCGCDAAHSRIHLARSFPSTPSASLLEPVTAA